MNMRLLFASMVVFAACNGLEAGVVHGRVVTEVRTAEGQDAQRVGASGTTCAIGEASVTTDEDGTFRFSDLPPGSHTLTCRRDDGAGGQKLSQIIELSQKGSYTESKNLGELPLVEAESYPGTPVKGPQPANARWIRELSPYIVEDDIMVLTGGTLKIDPGVEVRVNGRYKIDVFGSLQALGTPDQKIVFTSNVPQALPGSWLGLTFHAGPPLVLGPQGEYVSGNVLANVEVSYGQELVINGAGVLLDRLHVHHLGLPDGRHAIAVYVSGGNVVLRDSVIEHNNLAGLYFIGRGEIARNRIIRNKGGVGLDAGASLVFKRNLIENNTGAMLSAHASVNAELVIENNTFRNNYVPASPTQVSPLFMLSFLTSPYPGGSIKISKNVFEGNTSDLPSDTTTFFVQRGTVALNMNAIVMHDNTFANKTRYEFYVEKVGGSTTPELQAQGNWWGTDDLAAIKARIHDSEDEAGRGTVLVAPVLTQRPVDVGT